MQYLKERDIIATNARGTAGVPISEHIMTMMLMLARKSFAAYKNQLARAWKSPDSLYVNVFPLLNYSSSKYPPVAQSFDKPYLFN